MHSLLHSVTNEWSFQGHLPSRALPTQRALCPGTPEQWMYRISSPVSQTNGHFKIIFWIELCWCDELCVLGNLNSEFIESFPLSPITNHFRTIFWVQFYQLKNLCVPGVLNNEFAVSFQVSPINGHFKTTFQLHLYQLKKLYHGRPE